MKQSKFPTNWNEERVQSVISHYNGQTEDEAVAENEMAFEDRTQAIVAISRELVPAVRELLAKHLQTHA